MKKLLWGVLFVLSFAVEAQALTTFKGGVNILPKPLSESAGKLVYENNGCAVCHGSQGKGDGPLAGGLDPKPRDFTDLNVMSRISDMSMYHAIKSGITDSAMPAWNLPDEQIFDLIVYIKTFLANSQTTINICLNEQRTIDLRNLEIDDNHKIDVDRKQFLKLRLKGKKIFIEPEAINLLRHFKETGKKLVRNLVTVTRKGKTRYSALIAVRVSDCLK
ncbi:MAG: cytochrome c [Nitrospinota bacterium]|nr:cytochrome c [Nitrospinota bacterium]